MKCTLVRLQGSLLPILSVHFGCAENLLHVSEVTVVQVVGLSKQGVKTCSVLSKAATYLLRLLVFTVLHCVVYVAQHCLNRIRLRQVQRKERHKRVIFNLVHPSNQRAFPIARSEYSPAERLLYSGRGISSASRFSLHGFLVRK